MQRCLIGPPVGHGDANEDVVRRPLRVLGRDIPVAPLVEDARVFELELRIAATAPPVLADEGRVWILGLRILVERLAVGVCGRAVEVVVVLLAVLSVIPLGSRKPEQSLLEDWVTLVPEREREAEPSLAVAEAEESILSPSIGTAARVIVREVVPAGAER